MFDTIEKSFTRYNLVILSLVVLASFIAIFIFARATVYQDINRELNSMGRLLPMAGREEPGGQAPFSGGPPPLGFVATVQGEKVEIFSPFEREIAGIPYQTLLDTAQHRAQEKGTISTGATRWMYQTMKNGNLHFVEISRQTRVLRTLVFAGLLLYFSLLILFWRVSRILAKRAVQPAKDAYQRQTDFIANVSHELKTPLAVITTNTEALLLSPQQSIAENDQWVRNIQNETRRMTALVSDMMVSLSPQAPTLTSVNLAELIKEVLLSFEPAIYEKNIHLTQKFAPVTVSTDPQQLKRACYVLLENAVNYTPAGGTIHLTIGDSPAPLLEIANTGGGIRPGEEDKVFERFYRGDSSRGHTTEGYGLGLPIAKQIVEGLGGKLTLEITDTICFRIGFPHKKR